VVRPERVDTACHLVGDSHVRSTHTAAKVRTTYQNTEQFAVKLQ
jgi:hypothetical protein